MIMADPNASGKTNRFVGICIQRGGKGLGATFVLRNIINNQGEVCLFCKKCLLNAEYLWYCMRKLGAAEVCEHGPRHAQGQEASGVVGLYH